MRLLLIPFAVLYNLITTIRNWLYDSGIWKSKTYDFPVVGVGNLKTGGTGKTPMIIHLIRLLPHREIATLSRGFGRNTTGFRVVSEGDSSELVGDEPALIKSTVPNTMVTVDENRLHGISMIQKQRPTINTILLDDVFQHRAVKPGHSILLTVYDELYIHDSILPAGRLRESIVGARRADTIIVTKCPKELSSEQRLRVERALSPLKYQKLFFAFEQFGHLRKVNQPDRVSDVGNVDNILLFTGIAKAESIVSYLDGRAASVVHIKFRDHHQYSSKDLHRIKSEFENLPKGSNLIVTTQKDAQRLRSLLQNENFANLPIYAIEHEMDLFESDREAFQIRIDEYINSY